MNVSIGWFSPGLHPDHHIMISEHAHPKHTIYRIYTMLEKAAIWRFGMLPSPPKKKNTPWHLQHLYPCAAVHLVPLPWHHFKQSNIQGYIGPEMNFNSWLFREWIQPHFGIDKYNRFLFGKYLNWNCQGPGVFSLIQEISSRLVHININLYIITSSCPLHSSSLSLPGYPLGYPKLSNWKSGYSANLKRILSCRLLKPRVILKVVWGQSTPENQWKPPWCSVLRSGIV